MASILISSVRQNAFILASIVVIGIGLASVLLHGGLRQGIDFSGGLLVQLRFSQAADLGVVREALDPLGLERAIVQHYGSAEQVLIRMVATSRRKTRYCQASAAGLQERMAPQQVDLCGRRLLDRK